MILELYAVLKDLLTSYAATITRIISLSLATTLRV